MYAMIKKIIESSNEIEKVLFNDKEHRKFILHEDELKNLECVCKILEPFNYVTERLSAEKICSANYVIPAISLLLNITYRETLDSSFLSIFQYLIHNRVKFYNTKYQIMNDDDLAVATFTNPNTKHFPRSTQDEKIDLLERVKINITVYYNDNKEKFNTQTNREGENSQAQQIKSNSKLEKENLNKLYSLEHDETAFVQIGIGNEELNNEIDRYHNACFNIIITNYYFFILKIRKG